MNDIEEQNIMVESTNFIFVFSVDYINKKLFVNVYNKELKETVIIDHEIEWMYREKILSKISKKPGTIFTHAGLKFMVRNHDMCVWSDESGRRDACHIVSNDSVYDTRYAANIPLLSRIAVFLKETWLKV